jgi:hypothetical protein
LKAPPIKQRLASAEKWRVARVFKGNLPQLQWNYTVAKMDFLRQTIGIGEKKDETNVTITLAI